MVETYVAICIRQGKGVEICMEDYSISNHESQNVLVLVLVYHVDCLSESLMQWLKPDVLSRWYRTGLLCIGSMVRLFCTEAYKI